MMELGCTVWLGTDNVMFVPPDMFGEMAFMSTVYRSRPDAILRSAVGGSALTGSPFFIRPGARANLFMIRPGKNCSAFQPRSGCIHHKTGLFWLNLHKCF